MAQDDRKNQTNSPGLYEQFAEIVNPEVQKMMSNAVSGGTYFELFQKASNSVLKRLGLLSPTSGLTTPENQIDPYRILAANGSKNTSVFDDVEAHVQQTNSFNPYNETQQPNDPEDREEHKRTQHLAILEANQMFDALLQENDFQIDPLSNYERAAYTSHMLGKPQDQRAALAKKFLNKDPKALGDLNPINALLAGFDPYAQLEDLEVPANIAAGVDGVNSQTKLMFSIKKELREEEKFRAKAYIPTPGDVPTIGFGFTKGVKMGDTMTKEEAEERLSKEVNTRVKAISKQIKDFNKFPENVQVLMLSSWYRGSLSGSPKTKRLINEGKYEKAADEFLNNDEYKNAVARGRRGIRPRMEKTSEAIRSLAGLS